ncbi:PadR family transcriptional regulator [Clostridium sp. CCUG 7971]|uniref:PadR family transcriptional regulator n=1 Tax=Clostridium sp. CCUG 7971 TaxID=2811414 RepID=UPI001ABAE1CF|nr:PadR family transcriptional regulator [Clostridium sp. CCUG 7971]MBO3444852.1 PadR family transcriptional regulator [Clostridium sp. CCUG 7971]
MVKLIILYYLNIKSTHGYEIQKFIQATGLDVWAKIKSGSIYYALSKMEKNGEVELYKEETHGSKVRKIYKITEKGKLELKNTIKQELDKPLMPIGTDKFIIPITFNRLDKEDATKIINKHIKNLEETLDYWEYWKNIKINESTLDVERISFEMTVSGIKDSIRWHKAVIDEYDEYIKYSQSQEVMIKNIDFGEVEEQNNIDKKLNQERIEELREIILNNPQKSKEALEELMNLMSHNK